MALGHALLRALLPAHLPHHRLVHSPAHLAPPVAALLPPVVAVHLHAPSMGALADEPRDMRLHEAAVRVADDAADGLALVEAAVVGGRDRLRHGGALGEEEAALRRLGIADGAGGRVAGDGGPGADGDGEEGEGDEKELHGW